MSRSTEFRASTAHTVDEVYAATVDRGILSDRLREMGGPGAGILEYSADANGAKYRVRHGIDDEQLPGIVKSFIGGGGITIERNESWSKSSDGYDGTVGVALPGMPASANGTMRIAPGGAGTELVVRVEVTVKVPLLGGMIEETVGQQIVQLLRMETDYTFSRLP